MIRTLEYRDIPAVIDLGESMCREGLYKDMNYDSSDVKQLCEHIILSDDWCGLVAVEGEKVVGMLLGFLSRTPFGSNYIAKDFVIFVKKPLRGRRFAIAMIREFCRWAYQVGALEVVLGITTGVHTERTKRLYELLGFEHVGYVMKQRAEVLSCVEVGA